MFQPTKTDIASICPECGGAMHIATIKGLETEPGIQEHSFTCVACLANASFKFQQKDPAQAKPG